MLYYLCCGWVGYVGRVVSGTTRVPADREREREYRSLEVGEIYTYYMLVYKCMIYAAWTVWALGFIGYTF